MRENVRVMVVDDSPTTRTMLREALALGGGVEVVGEAGTGKEAIERASELGPDVILMDVLMPDGDGVEAARTISSQNPSTRIVALTWSDDPNTVRDMLTAGAIGYVVKGGTIDELCGAIRRAATGEPDLDQKVLPAAMEDLRRLLEEERERREQIERLAKAKGEFIQVLSHELRTPLTVISGALRFLQQRGVGPDETVLVESAIRRAGNWSSWSMGRSWSPRGRPEKGRPRPGEPSSRRSSASTRFPTRSTWMASSGRASPTGTSSASPSSCCRTPSATGGAPSRSRPPHGTEPPT
jgi:DNA-binding NarL/FixJ family response regulator